MQIFVLRHGHAEPQQTTDEARNLTEKGRSDVIASVGNSSAALHKVEEIWSSSLVRAQQTASIAQHILSSQGVNLAIKTTDLITPESDPLILFDALEKTGLTSILLVSHQPFIGKFLDIFCGEPLGTYSVDTSSLAFIECDITAPGCGNLRWLRHVHG